MYPQQTASESSLTTARERNTREIMMMYETSFATLSERFFKGSSWPPCEYIEDLVDRDHVFCLLYKVFEHPFPPQCRNAHFSRTQWRLCTINPLDWAFQMFFHTSSLGPWVILLVFHMGT